MRHSTGDIGGSGALPGGGADTWSRNSHSTSRTVNTAFAKPCTGKWSFRYSR